MSVRRSSFEGQPQVTYAAVGGTLAPDLLEYPPDGFTAERFEARERLAIFDILSGDRDRDEIAHH